MKYIPSQQMKNSPVQYHKIESMTPWVIKDGTLQYILKKHCTKKHGSIVDIGCGNGATLKAAAPYFKNYYGIDLVSYLPPKMKGSVAFFKADINFERLPFDNEVVDVSTAFQVIEHLENPFLIMREIKRVLKPGGLFIFSVPNPFQITFKVKFLLTGNLPPWTRENNHLLFFTKAVFEKTYLQEFRLIETVHQRGAVPFWGRLRKIFGKSIKKHLMILPRHEWSARRVCYVLQKPHC